LLRVLLTGANGFIGSHLARRLVREGHQVMALIRPGGDTRRISDLLSALTVARCDLFATGDVSLRVEEARAEVCFHLAWCAEPGSYLSSPANIDFLASTLHLAERFADAGGRRFVGIGTCFEYDTDFGYLSETTPTAPRSLYAATKLSASLALSALAELRGMEAAWARVFYLYGPGEDERRLIPYVISSLLRNEPARLTEGRQIRDFLHVEDVAGAILALGSSDVRGPVNVGSGRPVSVGDVAMRIGDLLGRRDLVALGALGQKRDEPAFVCANNRLLRERTSWTPRYADESLEEGLRSAIDWWRGELRRA
jgi:nucleoside-diphosphate-sugar epimerase